MASNTGEEVGNWKKEKVIGSGGFGYVVLWRNKISNETIALKECRWGHDPMMTPKHRSRWKLEVDMMSRLNHPNVVRAIPVPPELDVPVTGMPLLAMEYCTNGDLRKILNKPENCCGVEEKHVRLIMKHVSAAVNYLHSMRIIHRDLKPENIVIQNIDGNIIYKLIDLGYAKELDQGSLCTSFVGTLQYLAPELFMSQKYSCTVDYWSLGLVTHEIITGLRPFLPDKSPAEWIPIIKQKSSKEIRAFLDADKNIVFSEEIAPFHYISSTFQKEVECWLQLMLDWDPKKRGRYEESTAFSLLDTILNKKVALVFCADTFKLFSFLVNDTMSLEDFSKELESKSGIPIDQQEILFPDGHPPSHEKGISQFVANMEEEELLIFLFNKSESLSLLSASTTFISPAVENMMRNPHDLVDYQIQRVSWSQAVFLCKQECALVNHLIQAFKANLIHLLTKTSYSHKSVSRMAAEMNKLLTKCTFFRNSLEQDLLSYEKQAQSGGFTSETLHKDWKNTFENLKKVDLLRQKVVNLEAFSSSINTQSADLQKLPYARSKCVSPLDDTLQKVFDLYGDLRRRPADQRKIPHNNADIVRLLCLCLQRSHTLIQDLVSHIRRVKQIKRDIDDCLPQIINILKEISDWDIQIDAWQAKRQRAMWKVVDSLVDKVRQAERSSSPLVLSSSPQTSLSRRFVTSIGTPLSRVNADSGLQHLQESPKLQSVLKTPPIITPPSWNNRLESLSVGSTISNENSSLGQMQLNSSTYSSGAMSLSTLLDMTSEDTRRVKKENEILVESFQNMMETLKSFRTEDSSDVVTMQEKDVVCDHEKK